MGSKNSKPENSDSQTKDNANNQQTKKVVHVHKVQKELPIIEIDADHANAAGQQQVVVPPGGAKIVFKGQDGSVVKMDPVQQSQPTKQVKVIHTGGYSGSGGVVYSVPADTVASDGNTKVVVVSRPRYGYYYDPFYYPYYGPYYGCYRYPRYYYY